MGITGLKGNYSFVTQLNIVIWSNLQITMSQIMFLMFIETISSQLCIVEQERFTIAYRRMILKSHNTWIRVLTYF